ncbi:MAG: 1-phosphofructokinase [Clostridiales bacterium]|jgi:1-phosphofructokinase|nr:1-phosphofructokinase [Clostridiales bacterium]
MIVTVTLNPALDRTVYVPDFRAGEVNRALSSQIDAGGKGINVSKALKELGGESVACGLIGGQYGRTIKQYLKSVGIIYDFVDVVGETRVNIKIVDKHGVHTDINEPGFEVTESDLERLKENISHYAKSGNIIVISGSLPPNFSVESYGELCKIAAGASHFIVDAAGEALRESLKYCPDYIKPNVAELEKTLGRKITTDKEIVEGARDLMAMGAKNVAVSNGAKGCIFVNPERALRVKAPEVQVKGPVGAGDVMVAGIAHSIECDNDFESLARFAVAAGTASVTIEGTKMASRRTVLSIFSQTTAEYI